MCRPLTRTSVGTFLILNRLADSMTEGVKAWGLVVAEREKAEAERKREDEAKKEQERQRKQVELDWQKRLRAEAENRRASGAPDEPAPASPATDEAGSA